MSDGRGLEGLGLGRRAVEACRAVSVRRQRSSGGGGGGVSRALRDISTMCELICIRYGEAAHYRDVAAAAASSGYVVLQHCCHHQMIFKSLRKPNLENIVKLTQVQVLLVLLFVHLYE